MNNHGSMVDMRQELPILGFDFDDVLFDFMGSLNEWHNDTFGTTFKIEDYYSFDLHTIWNCDWEVARARVWDYYHSEQGKAAVPVVGAVEALKQLQEHYRLVIITARPDSLEKEVTAWLAVHFAEIFDEVIFTNHYHGTGEKRTKSSVCVEIGVQIFIEDALHNAEDVAGAGIPVLLFDTPWNREALPNLVTRVSSWDEVIEKITELVPTR